MLVIGNLAMVVMGALVVQEITEETVEVVQEVDMEDQGVPVVVLEVDMADQVDQAVPEGV